jgi:hypothetical protein
MEGLADPGPVGQRPAALAEDDPAVAGRLVVVHHEAGVGDRLGARPAHALEERMVGCGGDDVARHRHDGS